MRYVGGEPLRLLISPAAALSSWWGMSVVVLVAVGVVVAMLFGTATATSGGEIGSGMALDGCKLDVDCAPALECYTLTGDGVLKDCAAEGDCFCLDADRLCSDSATCAVGERCARVAPRAEAAYCLPCALPTAAATATDARTRMQLVEPVDGSQDDECSLFGPGAPLPYGGGEGEGGGGGPLAHCSFDFQCGAGRFCLSFLNGGALLPCDGFPDCLCLDAARSCTASSQCAQQRRLQRQQQREGDAGGAGSGGSKSGGEEGAGGGGGEVCVNMFPFAQQAYCVPCDAAAARRPRPVPVDHDHSCSGLLQPPSPPSSAPSSPSPSPSPSPSLSPSPSPSLSPSPSASASASAKGTPAPPRAAGQGLTLDRCDGPSDAPCAGSRECYEALTASGEPNGAPCRASSSLCVCFDASSPRCRISADCDDGERCAREDDIAMCVSCLVVESSKLSPSSSSWWRWGELQLVDNAMGKCDAVRGVGVCVAADVLDAAGIPQADRVFRRDWRAAVLCDHAGSCATPDHIVVFHGRPMSMRAYCHTLSLLSSTSTTTTSTTNTRTAAAVAAAAAAGTDVDGVRGGGGTDDARVSCTYATRFVNSPRMRRALRVPSRTGGLQFTAFAARFGTRFEHTVLTLLIRAGL